jgi:hypothetical protein
VLRWSLVFFSRGARPARGAPCPRATGPSKVGAGGGRPVAGHRGNSALWAAGRCSGAERARAARWISLGLGAPPRHARPRPSAGGKPARLERRAPLCGWRDAQRQRVWRARGAGLPIWLSRGSWARKPAACRVGPAMQRARTEPAPARAAPAGARCQTVGAFVAPLTRMVAGVAFLSASQRPEVRWSWRRAPRGKRGLGVGLQMWFPPGPRARHLGGARAACAARDAGPRQAVVC